METHFENMESALSTPACERVLADLKLLVHDSEDLLKTTAGDVNEKAKEARARVTAALQRAKNTCEHLQAQTVVATNAAAKKADTMIRAHPYESIGVALGVGLLVGVLAARK